MENNVVANIDRIEMEKFSKILKFTTDDILKMHSFVLETMKNDDDWLKLLDNYGLTENQKLFIAYTKGLSKGSQSTEKRIAQRMGNTEENGLKKFYDHVDAFEHISYGFSGWELNEVMRVLISCMKTLMLSNFPKERISEISMLLSDDFCRFAEDSQHINNNILKKEKNK